MSWNEMQNSEYYFKSNTGKHVIEIPANEFNEGDDSIILMYYNVYNGEPMILLHHFDRCDIIPEHPVVPGFTVRYSEGVNRDGREYGEILYVCENVANDDK